MRVEEGTMMEGEREGKGGRGQEDGGRVRVEEGRRMDEGEGG